MLEDELTPRIYWMIDNFCALLHYQTVLGKIKVKPSKANQITTKPKNFKRPKRILWRPPKKP